MTTLVLYFRLAQAYARSQMEYRASFLALFLGQFIWYGAEVFTLWARMTRFPAMNGWTFGEVLFIFSLYIMAWTVSATAVVHFRKLEFYIIRGEFDGFLTRPINPFFHLLASRFELVGLAHLAFSLGVFLWAADLAGIRWTWDKILYFVPMLAGAVMIQGAVIVIVSSLAFWTGKSDTLYDLTHNAIREYTWFPISIYGRVLQLFLTFVLPFAFINFFPAQYLLRKSDLLGFPQWFRFLTPAVDLAYMSIAYLVWTAGVNRYQSTGP